MESAAINGGRDQPAGGNGVSGILRSTTNTWEATPHIDKEMDGEAARKGKGKGGRMAHDNKEMYGEVSRKGKGKRKRMARHEGRQEQGRQDG